MKQFLDPIEAQALARAIVDTLPEPFLVLDDTLHLLGTTATHVDENEGRPLAL